MDGCVLLLDIVHKKLCKAIIYINGLILTPFSPCDIKCKKLNLMRKTLGCIFGVSSRASFSYFP